MTYEPRHRTTEGEYRAAIRRSLEEAGGHQRRCNLPVTGAMEPKCALPIGHNGPHMPNGVN